MSDFNDLPRFYDVADPTTCAWPTQGIAAAEAPITAGTDRYMRATAHAVARTALRELRQGTGNAGAVVAPVRLVPAPLTSMDPMGVAAPPVSPLSPAIPLGGADEAVGIQIGPGWVSGAPVLLLVGGGHNGVDTLLVGGLFAHSGCAVSAALATEHSHPVTLEETRGHDVTIHGVGYRNDDGIGQDSVEAMTAIEAFLTHGRLVLNGLTGIGATGVLRPGAAVLIVPFIAVGEPERRPLRVIAAGPPSGIGADDGTVSGPILAVDHTVTFTCPKGCQYLSPARHLCGVVEVVPLGLSVLTSWPLARRPVDGVPGDYLTRVVGESGSGDHKYTRGVVGLWAGSESYPGVVVLVASGVVRADADMVRLSIPRRVEDLVPAARLEVALAVGRVQVLTLGSGIDSADIARADEVRAVLASTLGPCGKDRQCPIRIPTVVDAGALSILSELLTEGLTCALLYVPTSHAGKAAALLTTLEDQGTSVQEIRHWSCECVEAHPGLAAHETCRRTGAIVLLKGIITLIAAPQWPLVSVDGGPGWMATVGSGDVLAGILGVVLAGATARWEQGTPDVSGADPVLDALVDSVAAGVRLHALTRVYITANPQSAGGARTDGCPIAALDIAAALGPARLELNWLQAVPHV